MIPDHPKNNSKQTGTSGMSDFQTNMIENIKSTRNQEKDVKYSIDGLLGCDKLLQNSESISVTSEQRTRMVLYSNKLREIVYSNIDRQFNNHMHDYDNNGNDDGGEDADDCGAMEM